MAFSQEIKDFVTGFKTGHDMVTSKEDRDLKAAHARYYNSLADRTRAPTDADLGVIPDDGSGSGGHVTTGFDDTRKALSSKEVRDAAQQRFDYLTKDLGWSPAAAAGIIANAHAESRFDTGALGDKGSAHGEFQWRGDRWTGFQDYAKANRLDPNDWRSQYSYMDHEASQMPGFKERMNSFKDASGAADHFALRFERPKGSETGDANLVPGIGNRRLFANSVYTWSQGGGGHVSNPQLTRPHHAPATGATGSTSTTPATAPAKTSGLTPGVSYAALDDQDENGAIRSVILALPTPPAIRRCGCLPSHGTLPTRSSRRSMPLPVACSRSHRPTPSRRVTVRFRRCPATRVPAPPRAPGTRHVVSARVRPACRPRRVSRRAGRPI
jgi:hypothetical protein